MGVHDGHRQRLRERFLTHGLDSFNELNALELLLFYAVPRKDTNELAHALLDRFGSLNGVFEATERELEEVSGVGEQVASLILLVPEVLKKARVAEGEKQTVIQNDRDAAKYLIPRFMNETNELALLLCLDAQKRVISCDIVGRGDVASVEVNLRRCVELAIRNKASYVILCHNHPDGQLKNSPADDFLTKRLLDALRSVNITLMDHLIIAGEKHLSYQKAGIIRAYNLM